MNKSTIVDFQKKDICTNQIGISYYNIQLHVRIMKFRNITNPLLLGRITQKEDLCSFSPLLYILLHFYHHQPAPVAPILILIAYS